MLGTLGGLTQHVCNTMAFWVLYEGFGPLGGVPSIRSSSRSVGDITRNRISIFSMAPPSIVLMLSVVHAIYSSLEAQGIYCRPTLVLARGCFKVPNPKAPGSVMVYT